MNSFDKIVDEIDCELYRLADKAYVLSKAMPHVKSATELYRKIDQARGQSFSMLPENRKAEFAKAVENLIAEKCNG